MRATYVILTVDILCGKAKAIKQILQTVHHRLISSWCTPNPRMTPPSILACIPAPTSPGSTFDAKAEPTHRGNKCTLQNSRV